MDPTDKRLFRRRATDRRDTIEDREARADVAEAKENSRWALAAATAALLLTLGTLALIAWGGR